MIEEILKDFDIAYNLKYVTFRYFNAAGHDPEGDLSERHTPETHLLPIILQAARGEREFVSIFGSDYDTSDGTCIRDYIHVNDLVNAHVKGIDYLNSDSTLSAEFNLGNGSGFSVISIIDCVKKVMNIDFEVKMEKRRAGDPSVLISDVKKARSDLNFNPEFKSIESIIKTLI